MLAMKLLNANVGWKKLIRLSNIVVSPWYLTRCLSTYLLSIIFTVADQSICQIPCVKRICNQECSSSIFQPPALREMASERFWSIVLHFQAPSGLQMDWVPSRSLKEWLNMLETSSYMLLCQELDKRINTVHDVWWICSCNQQLVSRWGGSSEPGSIES